MKTDINAVATPNLWPQVQDVARRVATVSGDCASTAYKGLAGFVTNLQIGRMESVLRQMSDQELTQSGINRNEIKRHARYLITGESGRT